MGIDKLIHIHFISIYVIIVIIFIVAIYRKLNGKKKPKLLSKEKFEGTLSKKMTDVTSDTLSMFNIWPYVNDLKKAKIVSKKIDESTIVYKVYRNSNEQFEHILLRTEKEHYYVIIVVNVVKKKVKGYYKLQLTNQYQ
jgi:hypothetical protein